MPKRKQAPSPSPQDSKKLAKAKASPKVGATKHKAAAKPKPKPAAAKASDGRLSDMRAPFPCRDVRAMMMAPQPPQSASPALSETGLCGKAAEAYSTVYQ